MQRSVPPLSGRVIDRKPFVGSRTGLTDDAQRASIRNLDCYFALTKPFTTRFRLRHAENAEDADRGKRQRDHGERRIAAIAASADPDSVRPLFSE
jgi:hypothetical protein